MGASDGCGRSEAQGAGEGQAGEKGGWRPERAAGSDPERVGPQRVPEAVRGARRARGWERPCGWGMRQGLKQRVHGARDARRGVRGTAGMRTVTPGMGWDGRRDGGNGGEGER